MPRDQAGHTAQQSEPVPPDSLLIQQEPGLCDQYPDGAAQLTAAHSESLHTELVVDQELEPGLDVSRVTPEPREGDQLRTSSLRLLASVKEDKVG